MRLKFTTLFFIIFSFLPSCTLLIPDSCDWGEYKILGSWEIESRTINGITPLIIECC